MACKEYQRKYYLANREEKLDYQKRYAAKHKNEILSRVKKWNAENPEQVRKNKRKSQFKNQWKRTQYVNERYRVDPEFRLVTCLRSRIVAVLRGAIKFQTTFKLVGCSLAGLRKYLESKFVSGMTWENYGPVWHVDHIRPCASFDLVNPEQQRECFHFTNLQPLFKRDNLSKGAKFLRG